MTATLQSTDVKNNIEDFSGVQARSGENVGDNPYDVLIGACGNDAAQIQSVYAKHRVNRNSQQKEKLLSPDFVEVLIDPFLLRLENPEIEPGFKDPRNSLVLWARPPNHILEVAAHLQRMLKKAAPGLWLMPPHRMHMTALEVAHSKPLPEIEAAVKILRPGLPKLGAHTFRHRSRLVKPFISYDLAGIALSFLPAAGEPVTSLHDSDVAKSTDQNDAYTYHHLRRDLFRIVTASGTAVESRYVVPSAHITLARFLTSADHDTVAKRERWVAVIEGANKWLEESVWGGERGEWVVGQEQGIVVRVGRLWYGGGRTIVCGEGF
ncbi:Ureidoglycolate lyase [Rhizophlyctis rosea]|nr:Ureidoglycolate lyase [Rhizophlyctis rosea]